MVAFENRRAATLQVVSTGSAEGRDLQPGMGQRAADAYRRLRQLQHTSRLNEDSTQLGLEEVQDQQQAISQLWAHVLGER